MTSGIQLPPPPKFIMIVVTVNSVNNNVNRESSYLYGIDSHLLLFLLLKSSKHNLHKIYSRSLNQILQVLRRIRCLTFAMFLVTSTTLILYLIRDVMTVRVVSQTCEYTEWCHTPISLRDRFFNLIGLWVGKGQRNALN